MRAAWAAALFCAALPSCSVDPTSYVVVTVSGTTPDVHSLVGTAHVAQETLADFAPMDLERFALQVPQGATGPFSLDLLAYDTMNCVVADGHGMTDVEGQQEIDLSVPLVHRAMPTCNTLTVTRDGAGAGTVTSDPAGIQCGAQCSATFPGVAQVTLRATADEASFFAGWTGACQGLSTCTVALDGPAQVGATFARWSPVAVSMEGYDLHGIWGSGPDDVWAVGDRDPKGSLLLHFDHTGKRLADSRQLIDVPVLVSIFGTDPLHFWAGSENGFFIETPAATIGRCPGGRLLFGVWGGAPDNVWAVGTGATLCHLDGTGWTLYDAGAMTSDLYAVWGSSAQDLWAVGQGVILHLEGNAWLPKTGAPQSELHGLWGTGPSDIWAVGKGGAILHYDGKAWSGVPRGSATLRGVWGSGPADVWAVGDGGAILHYDGKTWSAVPSGTTANLSAVWGSGKSDVWAVGDSPNTALTVLHFPGPAQ